MILTNALWPVFALSSYLGSIGQQEAMSAPAIVTNKALYPGHVLYKLNDVSRHVPFLSHRC